MFAKPIKYVDYDGVEREETFYFNLSKAELIEVQLTHPGGYVEYLERVIKAKDQATVINTFKDLIKLTYGVKSEDGRRFMKDPELTKAFFESPAYNELFFELATNEDAAVEFVTKTLPPLDENATDTELIAKTKKLIDEKKQDN